MKKFLASFITLILLVSCCLIAAFPTSAVDVNYDDFDIVDGVIIEYLGSGGEVIIPSYDAEGNEVTRIDTRAFYNNKDVTAVYICEGITEIGGECFEGCVQLAEVSLPYSLEKLGEYSTFRHTSISSLVVPGNVKEITSDLVVGVTVEEGGLGTSFSDLVISPGVEVIKSGSLYYSGSELVVPDSVYKIEGAAWTYAKKEISIYICNPDCEIGTLEKEKMAYKPNSIETYTYSGNAPIALMWDSKATVKIYSTKDATLKDTVNQWKADFPNASITFIGITEEKLEEKNKWCEENGTVKPTKWVMSANGTVEDPDDPGDSDNTDNKGGNSTATDKNNNKNNANKVVNGGLDMSQLLPIILIAGGIFLLIIIAVVVVLIVVMNSKKKKKKKKKKVAVPAEETPAQEPVLETENLEEAPAEETAEAVAEEAPTEEAPAEDTATDDKTEE